MSDDYQYRTIPAQPGWSVAKLVPWQGSTPAQLRLTPIIGFEIERDERGREVFHEVRPLTSSGAVSLRDWDWAFRQPDGKFDIRGMVTVDSEKAAISAIEQNGYCLNATEIELSTFILVDIRHYFNRVSEAIYVREFGYYTGLRWPEADR
jgi:hypothetical protein